MGTEAVLMLSGGLDSMVLTCKLAREGKAFRALHLDFGKLPRRHELHSAKHTALDLDVPLEIGRAFGLMDLFAGYLPKELVVADELDVGGDTEKIYCTFTIPLSIATCFAQATKATEIYVAAVRPQAEGRKDLPGFITKWPEVISLLSDPRLPPIAVPAPFLELTKAEVVEMGDDLNAPMECSWSCYYGEIVHCGTCRGCLARMEAFAEAGVRDETAYASVERRRRD